MAKRLWDKGDEVNHLVHDFTVGTDPEIDRDLIRWDVVASAAHARMLVEVGLLTSDQCVDILGTLRTAHTSALEGTFHIARELEDCHTALEAELVEKLGETGRRVHAGRSRNDQVLVAVRLFLKDSVLGLMEQMLDGSSVLATRAEACADIPMPGYTHMQPAMPTTVGTWLQSYVEWSLEILEDGLALWSAIDSNPLGVGSGFGVSLPLDRARTTKLLHFDRIQRNPIHVQNSRGRMELKVLRWFEDIASMVEKFASDLLVFSSQEFRFFTLPTAFTTGSSIMPQKRNPDVLELMRGSAGRLRGAARELEYVICKLPSSYHRDFQLTKEPIVRAHRTVNDLVPLVSEVARGVTVNEEVLAAHMSDDLYATYDVFRSVQQGHAFRDAYAGTAKKLKDGVFEKGDLERDFAPIRECLAAEMVQAHAQKKVLNTKIRQLRDEFATMEKLVLGT